MPAEVQRLREEFASGRMLHPYLPASYFVRLLDENTDGIRSSNEHSSGRTACKNELQEDHFSNVANFTDLAAALSLCCGVRTNQTNSVSKNLATSIGGEDLDRRHIIFVLCDGLGTSILKKHLTTSSSTSKKRQSSASFFLRHNQPNKLRAVFPSTTPAALTTLVVANWPGQHGIPGWDLRDPVGCDFPGQPSEGPIHLRILAQNIMDVRGNRSIREIGMDDTRSMDRIFLEKPWVRKMKEIKEGNCQNDNKICGENENINANKKTRNNSRKLLYINAYNGDDFPTWYQDDVKTEEENENDKSTATDFSVWQNGRKGFETFMIQETSFHTLGTPKGSQDAIEFFRSGINAALRGIAQAEKEGHSTYMYLYTAHPDKHMHALGVDHPEVQRLVEGLELELERLWDTLGDRTSLMREFSSCCDAFNPLTEAATSDQCANKPERIDASLLVTADHGHITVQPEEMIQLPEKILECLEYANIGVHGKGRHAYLHCRSGYHDILMERWLESKNGFAKNFLLLTIDEAADEKLFGPTRPKLEVRPRLGDYVIIALGNFTLVTPKEWDKFCYCSNSRCQGAHGSLLREEMDIPFILCTPT